MAPSWGRILIYVWAIEQDEQSRRNLPTEPCAEVTSMASNIGLGRDVFVPWVLSKQNTDSNRPKSKTRTVHLTSVGDIADSSKNSTNGIRTNVTEMSTADQPEVFNRYYHMFAGGELAELVRSAASDLGLHVGSYLDGAGDKGPGPPTGRKGLEIVQDGWEKSNYFVELRCWET